MDYEILSHTKRVAFIHNSDYGVIEIETRGRRDKSALFWVEAALECIKNSSDRIDILRPSKVFIDDKRDYLFKELMEYIEHNYQFKDYDKIMNKGGI